MDTGELRRRILRALEESKNDLAPRRTDADAALRRAEADAVARAYDDFLATLAVPMLKQAIDVLKAERQNFVLNAPAGSARIVSEAASDTFLEFVLDSAGNRPQVLGRVSRPRGRQRVVVDERPLAAGKAVADLTEEDVAAFLVTEIPRLLKR
jgi:hypothetical protein